MSESKNKLLYDFMFDYNITPSDVLINIKLYDATKFVKPTPLFFCEGKKGDMLIYYPALNGKLVEHNKKGNLITTNRRRLANPYENNDGSTVKYLTEGNVCIFFPPRMVQAYKNKEEIETLIVTEGEKKAFVASKNGFDCIGISGIWNFCTGVKDKLHEQGLMLPELKDFLKVCNVKRLVYLQDSDALDCTIHENKSATDRPYQFYGATKRFAELVFQEGVQFYHSYINPHLSDDKNGLDDLIANYENYQQRVLLDFYDSVTENKKGSYFCTTKIESIQNTFIKQIFLLNDPEDFYKYHKAKLIKLKEFRFDNRTFIVNPIENTIEEVKNVGRQAVWVKDGCYYGYDMKGNARVFTNFTMEVLFLLRSSTNPKRIMEFKNVLGQTFVKEFTMDDLVSVSNLRKKLIGDGSFIYKGDMYELLNLHEMLFKEEKQAIELTSLGWQKNNGFFAFSNGITKEGKFFPINEYGVVNHHEDKFYLPAYSSLYTDADEAFENERNFKHIEFASDLTTWSQKFYKTYGANGAIGIAFFIAALFRDVIYNEFKEFPLLSLFGQKGSGKSTMAKSLMYLYGNPQNAISLENASSTKKGVYRKFSQYRNAFIWLDEYKNTIHPDMIGLLKNLYDGIGYERAQMSQDNRTTSNPVLSSAIVSGQDMPTADVALFTRVILLMFKNNEFKEADRLAYADLKAYEKKGLTQITINLLANRDLINSEFLAEYKKWFTKITHDLKYSDIPDRLMKNCAMLIAPCALIHEKGRGTLPFSIDELYGMFLTMVKQQNELLADNQEISVFWEGLEILSDEKVLNDEIDFKFINKDTLAVRFTRVFGAYSEKFRKMNGRNGLDKLTITNYLKNSPAFIEVKDGVRFDGAGTTAYIFKYKELGINLRKNLSAEERLQLDRDKVQEQYNSKEKTVDQIVSEINGNDELNFN
jgi:ABC-type oligopeptide transport system ATPase subunit